MPDRQYRATARAIFEWVAPTIAQLPGRTLPILAGDLNDQLGQEVGDHGVVRDTDDRQGVGEFGNGPQHYAATVSRALMREHMLSSVFTCLWCWAHLLSRLRAGGVY